MILSLATLVLAVGMANADECAKKTKDGGCCLRPFDYAGVSYDDCTTKDHNEPWCYIEGGGWENCGVECDESAVKVANGECCNFPFAYKGEEYSSCTGIDNDDVPWCYTPSGWGNCQVDGQWGEWGELSACSASCGSGTQTRTRTCDNPQPSQGGKQCEGEETETVECQSAFHCPGEFFIGVPGNAFSCPDMIQCKGAKPVTDRQRCETIAANAIGKEFHGAGCMEFSNAACFDNGNGSPINGYIYFNTCAHRGMLNHHAPVCETISIDGSWGHWEPWGKCSKWCGVAEKVRTRKCDSPEPCNGGLDCAGEATETGVCNGQTCPPPANYYIGEVMNHDGCEQKGWLKEMDQTLCEHEATRMLGKTFGGAGCMGFPYPGCFVNAYGNPDPDWGQVYFNTCSKGMQKEHAAVCKEYIAQVE